jgi:hypothetical protein
MNLCNYISHAGLNDKVGCLRKLHKYNQHQLLKLTDKAANNFLNHDFKIIFSNCNLVL